MPRLLSPELEQVGLGGGVALVCALLLTPPVIRLAHRVGWLAHPHEDRWHERATALGGGLAIGAAVMLALFASGAWAILPWPAWAGAVLLLAVGVADDFVAIAPGLKLAAQIAAAMLVLYTGLTFWPSGPVWLSFPLTFLWIVGVTNAFNLIDGMDGLAGGIAAIAAFALAAIAGLLGAPMLVAAAVAVTGAAAGFLWDNRSPARIFMGDGGSMFLGFVLALLAMAVQQASPFAADPAALLVPVLVLAVPIFDTVFVTVLRVLGGRPVAQGGTDHTMHRLALLGLPEQQTVLLLCGMSAQMAGLALLYYLGMPSLFYTLVLFAVVGIAAFGLYIGRSQGCVPDALPAGQEREFTVRLGAMLRSFIGPYWKTSGGMAGDVALAAAAFLLAYILRFEQGLSQHEVQLFQALPIVVSAKLAVYYAAGMYHGIWRYAGTPELIRLIRTSLLASLLTALGLGVTYGLAAYSLSVLVLDAFIFTAATAGIRFGFRGFRQYVAAKHCDGRRMLVYGSGPTAQLVVRYLRQSETPDWRPIGFIDDHLRPQRRAVQGLPIMGAGADLPAICERYAADGLIFAVPHLSEARKEKVGRTCRDLNVPCYCFNVAFSSDDIEEAARSPKSQASFPPMATPGGALQPGWAPEIAGG